MSHCHSGLPCQVCLIIVVGGFSIELLKQQVHQVRGKALQVRAFLRGGVLLALQALRVIVRTIWAKNRGFLELHFPSSSLCHSTSSTLVNQLPTLPGGAEYQTADFIDSFLQRLFHMASSGTPPFRCVPLSFWTPLSGVSHHCGGGIIYRTSETTGAPSQG